MALRRKGSAPWSLTKDTGLSDAPVSGSPFVEGDEVKPVIDAGYIDGKGLWQISSSNDSAFTFQDPAQAVAAGAQIAIEGINMINHDILIFATLDASGNNVPMSFTFNNSIAALTGTPYNAGEFRGTGIQESVKWSVNEYPGGGGTSGALDEILESGNKTQYDAWQFFKVIGLRGTVGKILITNEDGSDAGTISTAYMRLV